ncbi:hypothetical protein Bca101_022172 [Brassica carinata]
MQHATSLWAIFLKIRLESNFEKQHESLNIPLASANPNISVEVDPESSNTILAAPAVDTLISVSQFVEAEPSTPLANVIDATAVATPSAVQTVPSAPVYVLPPALVTQGDTSSDLLTNEEEGNVFKGNFASLDPEYSRFEMGHCLVVAM